MLNRILFLSFMLLTITHLTASVPDDVHIEQITSIQKQSWDLRNKTAQLPDKHSQNCIHQHLDEVVNNCQCALAAIFTNNAVNKNEKIIDHIKKAQLALVYAQVSLTTAQQLKAKL